MHEDRAHADSLGAGELVVGAVTDEQRFARLDPELLERDSVDTLVRLAEAARARKDLRIEEPRERCLRPDVDGVLAADGDEPDAQTAGAQLSQRLYGALTRPGENLTRERATALDELTRRLFVEPERREIRRHRARLAGGPPLDPDVVELCRFPATELRDLGAEFPRTRVVVVDERLEEVEDGRPRHALCTRTAVP